MKGKVLCVSCLKTGTLEQFPEIAFTSSPPWHNWQGICEDCFDELKIFCIFCGKQYRTLYMRDYDLRYEIGECIECNSFYCVECMKWMEESRFDFLDRDTSGGICKKCHCKLKFD